MEGGPVPPDQGVEPSRRLNELSKTIDRYTSLWGVEPTTYLKRNYNMPAVKKSNFQKNFPKEVHTIILQKIIVSGIRHVRDILG
jgi:hypothetical protein